MAYVAGMHRIAGAAGAGAAGAGTGAGAAAAGAAAAAVRCQFVSFSFLVDQRNGSFFVVVHVCVTALNKTIKGTRL